MELWDGQLVERPVPDQPHVVFRGLLADALFAVTAAGGHVVVAGSLRLSDWHVPQPDVMVVCGRRDAYLAARPTPADVTLVVEVGDQGDLASVAVYAAGGVSACWLVDLPAARVEAFTDPLRGGPPCYREHRVYGPGQTIPVALPGRLQTSLVVDDLLPAGPARRG